jgi:hypothetical protein
MKTAFLVLLFIWTILLIAAGWNNHGRKRIYEYPKRKMKCKDVETICHYRTVMAFNRKHLPDSEWVNSDIKSISRGVFIKCTKN